MKSAISCLLLFTILSLPAFAQKAGQDTRRAPARSTKEPGKKRGIYLAPNDCQPTIDPAVSKDTVGVQTNETYDGLKLLKLRPFKRLIVDGNSQFDVQIVRPLPSTQALKGPGVYSSSPSSVKQNGDTVSISEYSNRFLIVTDHLVFVRNMANGTVVVKGFDEPQLTVNIASNGVVRVDGVVKDLKVIIDENGTAELERLAASNSADVTVKSNGTAHVTTAGTLAVSVISNGTLNYYGNPKSIQKRVIGDIATFQRRTSFPRREQTTW